MSYVRFATLVLMIFVITACGRRLPDEYFDTTSDFPEASAETVVANDAGSTDDSETVDPEDAESGDSETVAEEEADDSGTADVEDTGDAESVETEAEPEFELVEVPVDPIVEQVANADAANGEALIASGVPCTSCHRFDSEDQLVGPGLLNIPQRAEDRIEDVIAERYLYNSISHPNEYVVEGYPENVMPQTYANSFSEQEILDIVAYLMTLGDYPEREPEFVEVVVESSDTGTEDVTGTSEDEVETGEEDAPAESEPTSTGELDLSGVPATVDILAEHGSPTIGAVLFTTEIVEETSCATCHTEASDLDYTSAAYTWAAIHSTELHGELGTQYVDAITNAEMAHLVAYLASLSEPVATDD